MIRLTLTQINGIVAGQLIGDASITTQRISTDSRDIHPGDLFLALQGEHFDGHDYVAKAQALGAVAAIVSRKLDATIPQIVVNDTLLALGRIGQWIKQACALRSVAITGSSGKTTVKEMIAAVLGQEAMVLATQGNFNNEIGVPLTLLRLSPEIEFSVIELGANHQGEIAYTSGLVQPDVALITNIGAAHLEGFGSEQGIANAKAEIFTGLKPGGTAIYESSNPYAKQWQKALQDKLVLTWSVEGDASTDLEALSIQTNALGSDFILRIGTQQGPVHLPMPGLHNIKNALAAAAACHALGLSIGQITNGLSAGVAVPGRLEQHVIRPDLVVIDDSYNANLGSVKAAIDVLVSDKQQSTAFIFGDMAELGDFANSHHQQVGDYAREQGVNAVFTLGNLSFVTQQAFAGEGCHCEALDALMTALADWIQQQQQPMRLLIKGSRSAAMERVLAGLKQWQAAQEETSC